MIKKIICEVCVDSVNSAVAAENGGGDRIELCQALSVGGLTPSPSSILWCCDNLNIKVFVLIRPRSGDFVYNKAEFEQISCDIKFCKKSGASGIVIGFLNSDGSVDSEKLRHAVQTAHPLEVTFHRAFDRCADWEKALEEIISCGCSRILTSGLHNTAAEGKDTLKRIVEKASDRIKILVASGLTPANVEEIVRFTNCKEVHFSAKTEIKSKMSFFRSSVLMGSDLDEGYSHYETSEEIVKKIVKILS